MSFLLHVIHILSLFLFLNLQSEKSEIAGVIVAFNAIPEEPVLVEYSNTLDVNNSGGHLQGVQLLKKGNKEFALLSGSSNRQAYCAVVQMGMKNEVIQVKTLMEKPFKHAGGIQVFEDILVVGIEDNNKKDKSKVCLYNLSDPENLNTKPLSVIQRKGEVMRATAGCVGITKYRNNILVAVGDWDTKHIDFYVCDEKKWQNEERDFELIFELDTRNQAKTGWINNDWSSYQNINLFTDGAGNLFLVGLGQDKRPKDVADLFLVKENGTNSFTLQKVASKTFACTKGVNFRSGAGFYRSEETMGIIACGSHINQLSYLNIFQ
jgi:hypothetical protein